MKSLGDKPSLIVKKGDELFLPGEFLAGLLQAVLAKGMPFRFKLKGVSMSPFLRDGDVVTVYPFLNSVPRRGDVVAFIHPKTEKLAIHRIIKGQGDFYSLKGDNNIRGDGLILKEDILGHVKKVERLGKEISFSLGPEKSMIAALSRMNLFHALFRPLRGILRLVRK